MPRMVGYLCEDCDTPDEELFNDTEERPKVLTRTCEVCGGRLLKWDFKSNSHRWYHSDRNGI